MKHHIYDVSFCVIEGVIPRLHECERFRNNNIDIMIYLHHSTDDLNIEKFPRKRKPTHLSFTPIRASQSAMPTVWTILFSVLLSASTKRSSLALVSTAPQVWHQHHSLRCFNSRICITRGSHQLQHNIMILRVRSNVGTWKVTVDEHDASAIRKGSTITIDDVVRQNHELFGDYKVVKGFSFDPSGKQPLDETRTLIEQGIVHGSMLYCRLEEYETDENESTCAQRKIRRAGKNQSRNRTEGRDSISHNINHKKSVPKSQQSKNVEAFSASSDQRNIVEVLDSTDEEGEDDEVKVISPPRSVRQDRNQVSKRKADDSSPGTQSSSSFQKSRTESTSSSSSLSQNKFSIASYNVWFGPPDDDAKQVYPKERMAAIADCLKGAATAQSDCPLLFVGLQELTPSLVDYIRPQFEAWGYKLYTQPLGNVIGGSPYGVGMAVPRDLAILEHQFVPYRNSIQGRGLLYARTRTLLLATTHLESYCGPNYTGASEREMQLVEATQFCKEQLDRNDSKLQFAMIAGDMNWDDERKQKRGDCPQNQNLLSLLSPRWKDPGTAFDYTYDAKENPMLNGNLRRRFDRCIYCGPTKLNTRNRLQQDYRSISFQKVGIEVVPNLTWEKKNPFNGSVKKMPVAASDHFGIVVSFQNDR